MSYQSGDEFHWEWAVGFECMKGLVLGVVGYDYRQITGDSGSGAKLGPFEGSVDAIGPGLSYTTVIDKMPVTLNLRSITSSTPITTSRATRQLPRERSASDRARFWS